MFRTLLTLPFLLVATVNCAGSQEASPVSQGWVTECPGGSFCFSRPPDLRSVPVQMIDSLVGVFENSALTLHFDMGQYPVSLDHLENPVIEDIAIDGRPAQTLAAGNEIVLRVPEVASQAQFTTQFTMRLVFRGAVSRETALRIFQSIKFTPSGQ